MERRDIMCENREIYSVLDEFFHHYFVERDAEKTLSLLSDHLYSIGTGEGEVALEKAAFRELLYDEIALLPGLLHYTITNYNEKRRMENCWDCFCNLEMQVKAPNEVEALYFLRVTAGLHKENDTITIDTLHASESSSYQEEGEYLPMRFISEGPRVINRETQHELLEIISQIMPGGIIGGYVEKDFPLYVANDRLLQMVGYESYQAFEADIHGYIINCIHPEDRELISKEFQHLPALGDQYEIEYRMRKQDGTYLWVHDIGRRTVSSDGRDAIISVLIDISQQVNTQTHLLQEASNDPLTGVYNRKGGKERITHAVQTTSDYVFFMVDLDNFKQVNDIYGHEQGDRVLCYIAEQMMESFRKSDTVCRLGGDEFAVFVTDCQDVEAIERKVTALIQAYGEMTWSQCPAAQSSLSVGGVYGHTPRTFAELYQLADQVLYEIKKSQKGQLKLREI